MWEDDPEVGGDDLIDNFIIANLSSLFDFNQFHSLAVIGMYGIGKITLAFSYLTTNPTTCNTEDNSTFSTAFVIPGGKFYSYSTVVLNIYISYNIITNCNNLCKENGRRVNSPKVV